MSETQYEKFMKSYDSEFIEKHSSEIQKLSDIEKKTLNHIIFDDHYHYNWKEQYKINTDFGYIAKLSETVRRSYGNVVKIIVPEEFVDDFYYMLDNFTKYQYAESYYRRSFRSNDYSPFVGRMFKLMYDYYLMGCIGHHIGDLRNYLLKEEEGVFNDVRIRCVHEDYVIASRIDAGDEEVIGIIKEMITSENNTMILSYQIIRAVIKSSNEELHDLMCKLLVAARLSEGLRQAICESADCGTAEAFFKIVKTIKENNLIRFSSVKRAVGTWTGLAKDEDPDKLASKILDDIIYVLESRENALEYINTTDAVHIYMGLWGLGFYSVYDALNVIFDLLGIPREDQKRGLVEKLASMFVKNQETPQMTDNNIQLMTIGYFCQNLEMKYLTHVITNAVLEAYPEDYKLFSMFRNLYVYSDFSINGMTKASKKLRKDRAFAEKHYNILYNMYNLLPKKKMVFSPMLFPWYSSSISKSDLLVGMLNAARVLEDNEKIDFICEHLSEIETGTRSNALEFIGESINSGKQRAIVINSIADKESYTRRKASKILSEIKLDDDDYEKIESFTKYKTADLRQGVIEILKKRDKDGLNTSIVRMLSSKEENVRLASLDLLEFGITEYKDYDFSEAKKAVSEIESPTEREEILIGKLTGETPVSDVTAENGYGLYDPKAEFPSFEFNADSKIVREFFSVSHKDLAEMYFALMKIIDDNSTLEYKDSSGEEHLLGEMSGYFPWLYSHRNNQGRKVHECVPFHDLWADYYRNTIKTPHRFWALYILNQRSNPSNLTMKSRVLFKKNQDAIFGESATFDYEKELILKDKRFNNSYFYSVRNSALESIKSEFELTIPLEILQHTFAFVSKLPENELWLENEYEEGRYWSEKKFNFPKEGKIRNIYGSLYSRINENFETNFRIFFEFSKNNNTLGHYEKGDIRSYYSRDMTIPALYFVKACMNGIITEDIFYKSMFEIFGFVNAVPELNPFLSRSALGYIPQIKEILKEEGKDLDENNMIPEDSEFYKKGHALASKLMDKVLDVELKRGDSETVFTKGIVKISAIYGIDRLMEILRAFGNDSLSRSSYYWYGNVISKKDSLSHLLNVCYPSPDDNAEKLAEYLSKSKVKDDRLIEVAMFAPQWIDIIQDYLKLDGFKCGCYYFMAHTAEYINDRRLAMIAKFTPLTQEELNGGCFDVKWFNEAYGLLGDKMFNKLYKSAKYISSSNMHTRARKFADAALGKMDIAETEATISDKRNKDLLLSLAVIPSKNRNDILQRYEFIQKFLKESKQFGAQRRASESSAVQYALKNLAVTAGYSDETRLTLSMETELAENNIHYFSWVKIGDYDVVIDIDKKGVPSLKYEKNGKALKSTPAAIKKNEDFVEMKSFCDKLKQQYRRTVKMFELAMEERDAFSFGELVMLCKNPVTKSIVENLVFVSADEDNFKDGLIFENKFVDGKGNKVSLGNGFLLRVAHPYDLYAHKIWSDYQQIFLKRGNDEGKKQPFRQVFRELYVKLPEELDKERSLMFAGNQIQTKRTVGALQSRRWVADYEDGLQKIYYKDNIIAGIYAVADWFSPSDIEAPTLEGVTFSDRKDYSSIKIKDIPDIVYSEVMRDVDLAVSVAHTGGVDPETSHSTVEMRKVILEFNLDLFGIKNVSFEKNHAIIDGKYGKYSIHLGSGVIHKIGGRQINVVAVSSGKKSKIFLPFIDEDPKTAEIMTKVLTFAQDDKIKDPFIMEQIR